MKHIILITEDISEPIDEGIKKYSFKLSRFLIETKQAKIFTSKINHKLGTQYILPKNKFFFSVSFFKKLKTDNSGIIIYVPNSSSTLMSFLRLKMLSFFTHKKTVMISIQKREHSFWQRILINKLLRPNLLFTFSERERKYYKLLGINAILTTAGVNLKKYTKVDFPKKQQIREKLNLPTEKKIVLHVGHINKGRNISILKELVKKGFEVIVIGSTCFPDDVKLKKQLQNDGIRIISEYITKINEYYQASDLYVFPVLNDNSVIEFPLSILEAMACNIPVLSTPFGSIPYHFKQTEYFKYFTDKESLIKQVNIMFTESQLDKCNNQAIIINGYTWEDQFQKIITRINTL